MKPLFQHGAALIKANIISGAYLLCRVMTPLLLYVGVTL